MDYPDIITRLPNADIPFPASAVKTHVLPSDHGMLIFFEFLEDVDLPAHSHGGQWGTVLEGSVELTIDGKTTRNVPGDSYYIPAGVVHAVDVPVGTKAIDFFEEADRYTVR